MWEKPADFLPIEKETQVRVSHLLVKHRDSRRPASWRQVCISQFLIMKENITISKEEAVKILTGEKKMESVNSRIQGKDSIW